MLSRKILNVFTGLLVSGTLSLFCVAESRAAFGDIVGRYNSVSGAWWGGLTWKDGYLYENLDNTSAIYKRDPNTANLAVVGTIAHTAVRDIGLAWDEDNRCWWLCNPWGPQNVYRIPEAGGGIAFTFNANTNEYGIFYDTIEDVLWITNNAKKALDVYRTDGTRVRKVTMPWDQSGIVRVGDKLWIGRHETSYIYEFSLDGTMTGRYVVIPEGRFSGDMAFDGRYLWSRSNLKNNVVYIYKIDIDIPPATPTPTPLATPIPSPKPIFPVIDSGDYNGDGTSDIAVFRASSGLWAVRGVTRAYWGSGGDIPASGDYSGDGTTDLAVFRSARGRWLIRGVTDVSFGSPGDVPVPGDYDGDGRCDVAIYRSNSGLWAVRGLTRLYYGSSADQPVPGYYTGSSSKEIALFRPATGRWSIRGLTRFYYGKFGDLPVPGDYSASGRDEAAVYRPASRLWAVRGETRFYFGLSVADRPCPAAYRGDGSSIPAFFKPTSGYWSLRENTSFYYGASGDVPVTGPPPRPGLSNLPVIDSGDYTGNGTSEIALFRDSVGLWSIRSPWNTYRVYYGSKGDVPASGDYNGDGRSEIAVYRPASGLWAARFVTRFYFGGEAGELSAPGDYNGDGTCDSAVFNPRTAHWRVRVEIPFSARAAAGRLFGEANKNSAGGREGGLAPTAPFIYEFDFGREGDIPVPGYYTGGPNKVIATYGPSTGLWSIRGVTQFYYGKEGDFPVAVDFTGDGTAAAGIFRPSSLLWAIRGVTRIYYGRGDDYLPVSADYRGDGTAEVGIFRTRTGRWEIRNLTRLYFGRAGDTPAVGARSGTSPR